MNHQEKLDKNLQDFNKAAGRVSTGFTKIQKGLSSIREDLVNVRVKLAVYMERRRLRRIQFLNDRDWDMLMIIVLCAVLTLLIEQYMPAWLRLVVWVVLAGGGLFCVLRRAFRKVY